MSFEIGFFLGVIVGIGCGLYGAAVVSNAIVDKLIERVNESKGATLKRESLERIARIRRDTLGSFINEN